MDNRSSAGYALLGGLLVAIPCAIFGYMKALFTGDVPWTSAVLPGLIGFGIGFAIVAVMESSGGTSQR